MNFQEKIQLALKTSNLEEFNFKEFELGSDTCVLVTPKSMSVAWTQENKYLRSCIYRKADYSPVSLSFPKFTNGLEKPEQFPVPQSLKTARAILKMDGSTLILSKYRGIDIIRTRGATGIEHCLNKEEIDIFKNKYPLLFSFGSNIAPTVNYSMLLEWVSPSNAIVLKYPEPELYLIGAVCHDTYELYTQDALDFLAITYSLKRPDEFKFNSILEMMNSVTQWIGREGIVVYSEDDINALHKIKSLDYLKKHYFRSTCNINSLLDLFFQYDCPKYLDFLDKVEKDFDFECRQQAQDLCLKISDLYIDALSNINILKKIVEENKDLTQREFAAKVLGDNYKDFSSALFTLRKLGELNKEQIRKLIECEIK